MPALDSTTVPLLERLTQRRTPNSAPEEGLNRSLGLFDLVTAGFSSMVGAGIFVMTPVLTATTVGPAILLSYVLAGLAFLIGALTYTELSGRFPGIGSGYLYVYYVMGELAAGIVGTLVIIDNVIASASLVKSVSIYTDQLVFNGTILSWEKENLSFDVPVLAHYIDVFAILFLLFFGAMNFWGAKQTVVMSAIMNVVVLISLLLIIIVGFIIGSPANWSPAAPASGDYGDGGFFPYGFSGVFTGASLAYFSYNGFDAIVSLGCETKRPERDIPLSLYISYGLVLVLYMLVCAAISYVAPYYTLDHEAAMALAFSDMPGIVIMISVGALLSCATGSFVTILLTSRVLFSLAQDGLIFKQIRYVASNQVPVVAVTVVLILLGLGILLLDLDELVMLNSGGVLISFCFTNICVIVCRYQPSDAVSDGKYTKSEKYIISLCFMLWLLCLVSGGCVRVLGSSVASVVSGTVFFAAAVTCLIVINATFEEVAKPSMFPVPLCPWIPGLGIYVNSILMISLPLMTWVRLAVCIVLGLLIYISYGIRHSNLTVAKKNKWTGIPDEETETNDMGSTEADD